MEMANINARLSLGSGKGNDEELRSGGHVDGEVHVEPKLKSGQPTAFTDVLHATNLLRTGFYSLSISFSNQAREKFQ